MLYSWYHLHLPAPYSASLGEYEYTRACYRRHPAEFYFRARRFLLAAPGFFSRFVDIRAFQQLPALWMQPGNATRPFKAFTIFLALVLALISMKGK
jgi:hypothetical protein